MSGKCLAEAGAKPASSTSRPPQWTPRLSTAELVRRLDSRFQGTRRVSVIILIACRRNGGCIVYAASSRTGRLGSPSRVRVDVRQSSWSLHADRPCQEFGSQGPPFLHLPSFWRPLQECLLRDTSFSLLCFAMHAVRSPASLHRVSRAPIPSSFHCDLRSTLLLASSAYPGRSLQPLCLASWFSPHPVCHQPWLAG